MFIKGVVAFAAALFLLYRKVLLWRTLDIKIARTEAGIANKR